MFINLTKIEGLNKGSIMSFGTNLEKIRKDKKVSQSKLGEALGLTQQMISSYEHNLSSPNVEGLIKIAEFFNVSIDLLVGHMVKSEHKFSSESRFLRYFESLSEIDREKCIIIAKTIIKDRKLD